MARYTQGIVETARGYYVLEGKTTQQISELLKVPHKTVWNWKQKHGWDKDVREGSQFSLFLEMQKQFVDKIKDAIDNKELTDPGVVDSLWKLAKLMERMMPAKMQLSNLFKFIEDLVTYFVSVGESEEFMETLHRHIPLFADYLRRKYTSE